MKTLILRTATNACLICRVLLEPWVLGAVLLFFSFCNTVCIFWVHHTAAEATAAEFGSNLRTGRENLGRHRNNELNTPFLPTTTAVAVHLSVSTHVASRSTWQQGPLWQYYVPSSPFHRPSICSLSLSLVFQSFHLYFIYSLLLNNIIFCSPSSSSSLKRGLWAQSGPLHWNCWSWALQRIWQYTVFSVIYLCLNSNVKRTCILAHHSGTSCK